MKWFGVCMKVFYRLCGVIFIIVSYVIYKDFQIQKIEYQNNISFFLQTACENLIENQYGRHASFSGFKSNQDNKLLWMESGFDAFNNLVFLHLKHSSTLYYQDYAPQEVICSALLKTNKDLSKMTIVTFNIEGPRYAPTLQRDPFRSTPPIILTIEKIRKLINYNWPTPLKKPPFRVSKYFYRD